FSSKRPSIHGRVICFIIVQFRILLVLVGVQFRLQFCSRKPYTKFCGITSRGSGFVVRGSRVVGRVGRPPLAVSVGCEVLGASALRALTCLTVNGAWLRCCFLHGGWGTADFEGTAVV